MRRVEPLSRSGDVLAIDGCGRDIGEMLEVRPRLGPSTDPPEELAEVVESVRIVWVDRQTPGPELLGLRRVSELPLDHAQRVVGARELGLPGARFLERLAGAPSVPEEQPQRPT